MRTSIWACLVPRRSDFDRLERGELIRRQQEADGPGLSGNPCNQAALFQRHDHAVDGGRRDLEELLKIRFGGRGPVEQRIRVDEGQVLALCCGEARAAAVRGQSAVCRRPTGRTGAV